MHARFEGKALFAAALVGAIATQTACQSGPRPKSETPASSGHASPSGRTKTLPDTVLVPLDGGFANLHDIAKDKVVVIDLFASWCVACGPVSDKAKALHEKYGERVLVVGIDQGEDEATVKRFIEAHPTGYPIFGNPQLALSQAIGSKKLPTVILVAPSGEIRRIDHDVSRAFVDALDALLAAPDSPKKP